MPESMGIKPLRLDMSINGNIFTVHAALLWDEQEVILVDTGIPGQMDLIREAMQREGISFDKLTKIIITHQDRDHIGSLPELVDAFKGRVEVLAHEAAVPYLRGEVPLVKSKTIATSVNVDIELQDGDILPYAGGLQVIFTPGHTPDHISLYHQPSNTLISGDALTSENGVIMPPGKEVTPEWETAIASVTKFQNLPIETVITYHGGVCNDQIQERLAEIAKL